MARSVRVLVCSGVDCAGLGSKAVLLEIEELCAEHDPSVGVHSSVCTLQCANAPVVNIQRGGTQACDHFARVDSTQRCAQVMAAVHHADGESTEPGDVRPSALRRRADGIRWDALRQISTRRCRGSANEVIGTVLKAELVAAAADPMLRQRAQRRADRLRQALATAGASAGQPGTTNDHHPQLTADRERNPQTSR